MITKLFTDHILIEDVSGEKQTESGLILPSQGQFVNAKTGLVLLVGPGIITNEGVRIPVECSQGDMVLYRNYANWDARTRTRTPDAQVVEWSEEGRTLRIIPGHYLIAVLENEADQSLPVAVADEPFAVAPESEE